jgi:hypothetical protein
MLDRNSSLASAKPYKGIGLMIAEAPDFALSQYAGSEKELKKALGKIPPRVGTALELGGRTLLRINHTQIWGVGEPIKTEACITTPLSSSRTRIAIAGINARAVLAKLAAIDFHVKSFTPGLFASTGIHHTPVLIHCTDENTFHIYAMRTFGLSVWEALTDAALEFSDH